MSFIAAGREKISDLWYWHRELFLIVVGALLALVSVVTFLIVIQGDEPDPTPTAVSTTDPCTSAVGPVLPFSGIASTLDVLKSVDPACVGKSTYQSSLVSALLTQRPETVTAKTESPECVAALTLSREAAATLAPISEFTPEAATGLDTLNSSALSLCPLPSVLPILAEQAKALNR